MSSPVPQGISVVICTRTQDRWQYLEEAVRSIQAQTLPCAEIILVVDHNPDLLERIRLRFPEIKAVANDLTEGASESKNVGIGAAKRSLVAFLDDDAFASFDWLERLIPEFKDPLVAGAGGLTQPNWQTGLPRWFPDEFLWVVGCTHRGMPENPAPVRNLIACNMVIRREVFTEIGGFRNSIGPVQGRSSSCEETEFCIRASQHNPDWVWQYQPGARVQHQVPPDRTSFSYFLRRCFGEGHSKAFVTRLVGARDGLSSEKAYLRRTLPQGIFRNVREAFSNKNPWRLARAGAIITGTSLTALGYLFGVVKFHLLKRENRLSWIKPLPISIK